MSLTRHQHGWVIAASFAVALVLTMLPLPDWAAPLRPEWVAMVLIYWCLALPDRVGVGTGWLLGLLLDVARGAILGQHALALSLVAFLAGHFHLRIRVYPLWQQAFSVLMLVALAQMLVLWIKGVVGQLPGTWAYWLPSLTSSLLWPWVFLLLRDLRRRFRVA
ncbi:MAG: rod shape-determining protein MreD [Thiohalomonadaceae bacterium]